MPSILPSGRLISWFVSMSLDGFTAGPNVREEEQS